MRNLLRALGSLIYAIWITFVPPKDTEKPGE